MFTKSSVKYKFDNNKYCISLKVCNLLEQEGVKVVHTHRTFDLRENTISKKALIGKLVYQSQDKGWDIVKDVEELINERSNEAYYDPSKPYHKYVFERGTALRIKGDSSKDLYAIVAYNDIRKSGSGIELVPMDIDMYIDYLDKMWVSVSKFGIEASTINVPIFGNNFVQISGNSGKLDKEIAIFLIILSFLRSSKNIGTLRNLQVCLNSNDIKETSLDKWKTIIPFIKTLSDSSLGIKELFNGSKGTYAGVFPKIQPNSESISKWEYDVFISKNQKDYPHAANLKSWLESYGYKVFESEYCLKENGKSNYWDEIYRSLDNSRSILLLLSNNENGTSSNVQKEWARFLSDYEGINPKRQGNRKILGVIVDDTPIESICPEIRGQFECLYLRFEQERILNFL